ncbi:MAG: hypothetical protein Q9174_000188 [Haloplaca sp. 1 TL-2023]
MTQPSPHAPVGAKSSRKRSLFAKPTWAKNDDLGNSTDFFRRSNQSYVNIAAESERIRLRKQLRRQREHGSQSQRAGPPEKRRCISISSGSDHESDRSESDQGLVCEYGQKNGATKNGSLGPDKKSEPFTRSSKPKSTPRSLSSTYQKTISETGERPKQQPSPSNIVDLADEDSAHGMDQNINVEVEVTGEQRPRIRDEDDEFLPSDDEFAELARNAREKARRKRLQSDILSSTLNPLPSKAQPDPFHRSEPVYEASPQPDLPDPIVSIFITSGISNTGPLIVNRKISQRLKDVRLCWCQRQGFAKEMTETVFLTWRGQRLFDVTTCKGIGIGVDLNGNIVTKGQKDILGDEERQIHMEAMTSEIFEERERLKRAGPTGQEKCDAMAEQEEDPVAEKRESSLRIILKARGLDDFKLIVKRTTRMSRIVNAFKLDKKIESGREVFLLFDGDRLAPQCQVGETELNDMDYIDVYIK